MTRISWSRPVSAPARRRPRRRSSAARGSTCSTRALSRRGARRARVAGSGRPRVLVALGGGQHVRRIAQDLTDAILRACPTAIVSVAAGFAGGRRPRAPSGAVAVGAPGSGSRARRRPTSPIVAGGVTLYEACALGVPAVALSVVPAQQPAIRAFAKARAVINAGDVSSDGAAMVDRGGRRRATGSQCDAANRDRRAGTASGRRARRDAGGRAHRPRCSREHASMSERRAILFDLDDTLYPYAAFVKSGFRAVSRRVADAHGLPFCAVLRVLRRALRQRGPRPRTAGALRAAGACRPTIIPSLVAVHARAPAVAASAAPVAAGAARPSPELAHRHPDQRHPGDPTPQSRRARPDAVRRRCGLRDRGQRRRRQARADDLRDRAPAPWHGPRPRRCSSATIPTPTLPVRSVPAFAPFTSSTDAGPRHRCGDACRGVHVGQLVQVPALANQLVPARTDSHAL